jgi:hypothetical protein
MRRLLAITAIAGLVVAGAAQAEVVSALNVSLFNTGVNSSGTVLTNGATPDPHYTVVSAPAGLPTLQVLTSAGGFPIGPWLPDDTASAWIGPNTSQATGAPGSYDYQTTFDLTGLDVTTAAIVGQWSTDNAGLDILINGSSTGSTISHGSGTVLDPYSFAVWKSFNISGGFVSGLNTLDFIVQNDDPSSNPTGLRVEFSEADAQLAPEPGTLGMFGLGSAFLIASVRRRYSRRDS